MAILSGLNKALRRLVTQPVGELNRAQRSVRYAIDLARHCTRELLHDRAMEMAAALTYRTIFSLVPMVVLSLLVLRSFVSLEDAQGSLRKQIYRYLNVQALTIPADASGGGAPADGASSGRGSGGRASSEGRGASSGGGSELRATVEQRVNEIVERAYKLKFGSIGMIGLALFIWGALALVVTVEGCFNRICDAPSGRPWHIKIMVYWAMITLGPVLLLASLSLTSQLFSMVGRGGAAGALLGGLRHFTSLGASWLLLFLLYTLMPHVRIRLRPALVGSFVAAVLWESGKIGFQFYVHKAVTYSALYGSLGLIPLFLFWVYLTWLVVLFGLELTYALQAMKGRRFKHLSDIGQAQLTGNPQWLIPLMTRLGRAFMEGQTLDAHELAEELNLPAVSVLDLARRLEADGLLHQAQRNGRHGPGLALAVPPDKIPMQRLLDLGRTLTLGGADRTGRPGWDYLERLHQAQAHAVQGATLASVLAEKGNR